MNDQLQKLGFFDGSSTETLRAIRQFELEFNTIEQERRRVAKELHDEILPALARLTRTVQSSESKEEVLSILLEELHSTVDAFRDLLGELHPVDLEELGLVAALNNIAKRYQRLSGRCVIFLERTEDFCLSEQQELCLYRAVQAVLRMFCQSENDILLLVCERIKQRSIISIRCVDKLVNFADWLSQEKPEYSTFDSLCALAGARVELDARKHDEFPCDLIISTEKEYRSARISEQRKSHFFENLALESEREEIQDLIDRLILPRLSGLLRLAASSKNERLRRELLHKLQKATASLKEIALDQQPDLSAQEPLQAISYLLESFKRACSIDTELIADPSVAQLRLSAAEKLAIYRITQEALNNIEKHSAADRVIVSLQMTGDHQFELRIEDNGKGLSRGRSSQSRGLKIIKERAESINAGVEFNRSISFSTGTMVLISRFPSET